MAISGLACRVVADALAKICHGQPAGLAPELAGPRREHMPGMVRRLIRARGEHRLVIPVKPPGAAGKAMAGGSLLPATDGQRGRQTFGQWLATDGMAGLARTAGASPIELRRA